MEENENSELDRLKADFRSYIHSLMDANHVWPSDVIDKLNTFKEGFVTHQEFPLASLAREVAQVMRGQQVDLQKLKELLQSELISN